MDYLAAADEVASWLTSVAVERDGGLTWPTSPEVSDQAIPGLGCGALGSVLFFTDAYRTTKNDEYLRTAERGARWMHDVLHANDPSLAPGLFTGAAGIAVVVNELYRATGDDRYHDDIVTTFERLRERAIEADGGVNWRETTEILWGTAGIGCALLTIGAEHVGDGAVELAVRAGDWLIGQAESTTDGLR